MKNKHLVLLFLLTLVLGLLARRMPWRVSDIFQAALIQIDTSSLQSISISRPGRPELLLERSDEGWMAEQDGRPIPVAAADMAPILDALAHIESLRIVKSAAPDTLGLNHGILVQAKWGDRHERFYIGGEIFENDAPATFIELDQHGGIYLVKKHLRTIFDKDASYFRKNVAFRFQADSVARIEFFWARYDSVSFWEKNDSLAVWNYGALSKPNDSIQQWLQLLPRLNKGGFADHFDDSRAKETMISSLTLHLLADTEPLLLRFFYLAPPDIPEDLSTLGDNRHMLSPWVLHSSQNPNNYFSITDTTLLRRIFYGLSR